MQGDAREKINKMDSNPKNVQDSKKTSPKTPDTVQRPYKHNDTDLWDRGSKTRVDPSVRQRPPRFSNITETEAWHDFRCGADERKLLCPKPLRALRIPRRVVLRRTSTFHGENDLRLLRHMRQALLCL